jgi:hypothetical protein
MVRALLVSVGSSVARQFKAESGYMAAPVPGSTRRSGGDGGNGRRC